MILTLRYGIFANHQEKVLLETIYYTFLFIYLVIQKYFYTNYN